MALSWYAALMDNSLETPGETTISLLCPSRCTVILTSLPSPGDTVTILGSAGIHLGLIFTGFPLAPIPPALASTVQVFPSWTRVYVGGEAQRSPMYSPFVIWGSSLNDTVMPLGTVAAIACFLFISACS